MFTNIHSITISVLAFFLVCSVQSMEKKNRPHIYFQDYNDDIKKKTEVDDCRSIQNIEKEKPKAFNESDIYFSMSDSGCLNVIEQAADEVPLRCSLYESIFSDEELIEIIDEVDKKGAEKNKEVDDFIVIPDPIRTTTEIERPKPDKNICNVICVNPGQCLTIVEDYQNPSPNASPIHSCKEVVSEPVASDWPVWAKDMVCLASEKFAPVGDYLYGLNKDITTKY